MSAYSRRNPPKAKPRYDQKLEELSTEPSISPEDAVFLKSLVEKNEFPVNLHEWEIQRMCENELKGVLHEDLATSVTLFREAQKGLAFRNKETLYKDDEEDPESKQRLLKHFEELELGFHTAQNAIHLALDEKASPDPRSPTVKALETLSREKNCATTDVGIFLATAQGFRAAVARSQDPNPSAVADDDACSTLSLLQRRIADAAFSIYAKDRISGYKAKSGRPGANPESEATIKRRGNEGEAAVEQVLSNSGLKRGVHFTTQEDNEGKEDLTPDFCFVKNQPLHGEQIWWIEVKNAVVIPGVSFDKHGDTSEQIAEKAQRYNDRFGRGAIVWTKSGFTRSMSELTDRSAMHISFPIKRAGQGAQVGSTSKNAARTQVQTQVATSAAVATGGGRYDARPVHPHAAGGDARPPQWRPSTKASQAQQADNARQKSFEQNKLTIN